KNPTISSADFERLKFSHEDIPSYAIDNQHFKIPAGWLIEQCGWKGKRINDVGVHPLQALVLVNYGDGSGEEILKLSKKIQESVEEKFGIKLIPEVNIL
ncbi:MAG TPA: UDP-N-acetylenolpyruvoylglucosamine reductase, partial [Cyclobacteriaceae bacterium]|nr:UDP-N-acetylenolpyruvoylglucosamine reductase [Cyclobacteriaceae bacterium]